MLFDLDWVQHLHVLERYALFHCFLHFLEQLRLLLLLRQRAEKNKKKVISYIKIYCRRKKKTTKLFLKFNTDYFLTGG